MKKTLLSRLMPLSLMLLCIQGEATQKFISNVANNTPDSRFSVHADGTVTDHQTALMWKRCSEGRNGNNCGGSSRAMNLQEALDLAASSSYAGYSDWRLPNYKELLSIVAFDRRSPAINITIFPSTGNIEYWTSSPETGKNNSSVNFWYGLGIDRDRFSDLYVRLVRSGN